jgi:hypothetical protein
VKPSGSTHGTASTWREPDSSYLKNAGEYK